eukprot:sb/3466723/
MLCRIITPPARHLVRNSSTKCTKVTFFGDKKLDPSLIPEEETVGTALSTAVESVSNTALSSLPVDTFTSLASVTLILGAGVVIRGSYTTITQIWLARNLQDTLPHQRWVYPRKMALTFWSRKNVPEKVAEIRLEMKKYKEENHIRLMPNTLRMISLSVSCLLAGFNAIWLGFTIPHLGGTSFLWIPDVTQADPYPLLLILNSICSYGLYRSYLRDTYPLKRPNDPKDSDRPQSSLALGACGVGVSLFMLSTIPVPAIFPLFWTISNMTAIPISLLVTRYNPVRSKLGLCDRDSFEHMLHKARLPSVKTQEREEERLRKEYEKWRDG